MPSYDVLLPLGPDSKVPHLQKADALLLSNPHYSESHQDRIYFVFFLINIAGLRMGILSWRSGLRRDVAIIGTVLNSILLLIIGFVLLFGIAYLIFG